MSSSSYLEYSVVAATTAMRHMRRKKYITGIYIFLEITPYQRPATRTHEQHRDTYEAIVLTVVDGSGGGGGAGSDADAGPRT